MKRVLIAVATAVLVTSVCPNTYLDTLSAQDPESAVGAADYAESFRVYRSDGRAASVEEIIAAMADAEVVLIGEIHTDPVGHWLEAELLRAALAMASSGTRANDANRSDTGPTVALSLEMFERDVQGILNEYLDELITEDQFRSAARPWPHYEEDYRPLLEMAKEAGIPVLASNAPRRYVNRVSRLGPDALADLTPEALRALPPLPFPGPTDAYRAEWDALMSGMSMDDQCPAPQGEMPAGHVAVSDATDAGATEPPAVHVMPTAAPSHDESFMENGLQAQTLWDASMAYTITTFLDATPGALVIHIVGGFHVMNATGTPEKVQFYRPGTRSLVIHIDTAEDITSFDSEAHAGRGDFIVLTDAALDLNHQRNCSG